MISSLVTSRRHSEKKIRGKNVEEPPTQRSLFHRTFVGRERARQGTTKPGSQRIRKESEGGRTKTGKGKQNEETHHARKAAKAVVVSRGGESRNEDVRERSGRLTFRRQKQNEKENRNKTSNKTKDTPSQCHTSLFHSVTSLFVCACVCSRACSCVCVYFD